MPSSMPTPGRDHFLEQHRDQLSSAASCGCIQQGSDATGRDACRGKWFTPVRRHRRWHGMAGSINLVPAPMRGRSRRFRNCWSTLRWRARIRTVGRERRDAGDPSATSVLGHDVSLGSTCLRRIRASEDAHVALDVTPSAGGKGNGAVELRKEVDRRTTKGSRRRDQNDAATRQNAGLLASWLRS